MRFLMIMAITSWVSTNSLYHPVHVSVTNIELKKAEQKIEYSIRIFADDFEYALIHHYNKEISLTDSITAEEKNLVLMYLNNAFGIIVDDQKHLPACGDLKFNDESTWIFCEVKLENKEIEKIRLVNRLLIDFFPDQTNLTVFSADDYQAGFQFDRLSHETEIDMSLIKNNKVQNQ